MVVGRNRQIMDFQFRHYVSSISILYWEVCIRLLLLQAVDIGSLFMVNGLRIKYVSKILGEVYIVIHHPLITTFGKKVIYR